MKQMLYNYNTFSLLEGKQESKINKQREKIHKFFRFEPLIDLIFEIVVDRDSTKGLQYTTWFANLLKEYFLNHLMNRYKDWSNQIEMVNYIDEDTMRKIFENALTTGIIKLENFPTKKQIEVAKKNNSDIFSDENLRKFKTKLIETIKNSYTWIGTELKQNIQVVADWLKSPLREEEKVDLSKYKTLKDAVERAIEWHDSLKATGVITNEKGTILLTFPDGYYWIDLGTNSCSEEGEAMGHCATTNSDTLYSLRKKQSPHVTAAIENVWQTLEGDKGKVVSYITQMKGRGNDKPVEKYHPYIVELLAYPNVSDSVKVVTDYHQIVDIRLGEYQPENDFHISDLSAERIKFLYSTNPELINNNDSFSLKYKLYKENLLSKEEFVEQYEDLKIINDKIHFILNDWSDLDCNCFKQDSGRNVRDCWQIEVINNELDLHYNELDFDYTYGWDDIQERGFEEIIEKCAENEYEIYYQTKIESNEEQNSDGWSDEKDFTLSKENMKISEKKDDIIITTPEGQKISFESLMSNRNGETTTDDITYYDQGTLDDLRDAFDVAYGMAQALADEGEAWETVTKSVEDKLGPIISSGEGYGSWSDGIHFDINLDYISDVDNASEGGNKRVIDILLTLGYDQDGWVDNSDLLFEADYPYYGFSGSIDPDTLTEELINRIYDV